MSRNDDAPVQVSRRYVITSAAAAAALLGLPPLGYTQVATRIADAVPPPLRNPRPRLKFFSASEFALLDEFAETLIPADEKSGGARAANVAWFLDERLAESRDLIWRQSWHDDLAEIDRLSRVSYGRRFVDARAEQRAELMRRIS
ncbi:MAG: gluconate 2-dehydrogenase subunit 3 family protein, partial [Hyphomicrobiaceae bacterium]